MKRTILTVPILLTALTACGGSSTDPGKERVIRTDLYSSGKVERTGSFDALHKTGDEVLSKKDGTIWKDIEDGVPAEHEVAKESMFNRMYIGVMVNNWLFPVGE